MPQLPAPPAELKHLDFLVGEWRGEVEYESEGKKSKSAIQWMIRPEGNYLRQETRVDIPGMKIVESRAFGWDARRKRFWSFTLADPFPTPRVEWGTYKLGELVWLSDPWDVGAAEGPVESRATTTRDGAALKFRVDAKRGAVWEKIVEGRLVKVDKRS